MTPSDLVDMYQRFGGTNCSSLPGNKQQPGFHIPVDVIAMISSVLAVMGNLEGGSERKPGSCL